MNELHRMSLIQEGSEPMVRMAYLAIVGSFSINGVAELHSQLLRQGLFGDFYRTCGRSSFNNKTNGVTQRRWLAACNRGLGGLITDTSGMSGSPIWTLAQLDTHATMREFHESLAESSWPTRLDWPG